MADAAKGAQLVQKIRDLAAEKIAAGNGKVNLDDADFLDYSAQCSASQVIHDRNWAMRSAFELVLRLEKKLAELSKPDIEQFIVQEKEGYPTHFQPQGIMSKERHTQLVEMQERHGTLLTAMSKMADDPSEANVTELKEMNQTIHRIIGY